MILYDLSTDYARLKELLDAAPPFSVVLGFTMREVEETARIYKSKDDLYSIEFFAGTDMYDVPWSLFKSYLEDWKIGFVDTKGKENEIFRLNKQVRCRGQV